MADRLVGKAELLFKTTEAQSEKAIALLAFANRAGQLAQLLGDTGREQGLLSAMAAWIAKIVPSMLKDVVSKHDYSLVSAIRMMTRAANAAGLELGNVDIEKVEQQIAAALGFDLSLIFELSSTGANFGVEEWQVKAEFPLKYVIGGGEKDARAVFEGSGTGNYTRYQDRQAGSKLKMNAQSFPLAAKIEEFDACSGTAKLVVDGMYADTETYVTSDGSTADLDVVKAGWMIIFEEYFAQAAYEFDVNVRNDDPIAIASKIRKNVGVFDGVLTVRLVHNPK